MPSSFRKRRRRVAALPIPAGGGDDLDGSIGALEQILRTEDPLVVKPPERGHPHRRKHSARELSAAHGGPTGKIIESERLVEVRLGPIECGTETVIERRIGRAGHRRALRASGRDIYQVTAPLEVEAAVRLIDGRFTGTGALAPGEAFDAADFLSALSADRLTISSPDEDSAVAGLAGQVPAGSVR
ncbi:hypothetical protein [Brevibacterium permense]|uniref:hypothetical protein n=1 Tax=Brevibacterium permense TaxID=234834 RepID=UPI0021D37D92|nr:hypothetical protein [Brevibacterium permense]